jgi:folate-binding protein YgfZ
MPAELTSPLLGLPGAVAADGVDAAVASHYGDPVREQRALAGTAGWVDRSHRDVLAVPGADRLGWLHDVTSQHLRDRADGEGTEALVLSPHGHVEHHALVAELGGTTWLDTEPGTGPALLAYLESMRFMLRVEPRDATADWAVLTVLGPSTAEVLGAELPPEMYGVASLAGGGWVRRVPGAADLVVPRAQLAEVADRLTRAGAVPAGLWAYDALRVEARRPRLGMDTDHRTLPHEVGWIGVAVHLDKGCYRGQETVARVHNMGQPPRRTVLLHLSGETEELPAPGTPVEAGGRAVGRVGTAVRHHELGQVALALVKRNVADDAALTVAGVAASIDPDPAAQPVTSGAGRIARAGLSRSDTMRP